MSSGGGMFSVQALFVRRNSVHKETQRQEASAKKTQQPRGCKDYNCNSDELYVRNK